MFEFLSSCLAFQLSAGNGQPATLEFSSDGSEERTGFNIMVTGSLTSIACSAGFENVS